MEFLNPAAFYLLGTMPIVVALHFLKLRRRVYLVSSILLWRATAEDRQANVPFQRIRHILLPLLQVLFLVLLTLSVARPAVRRAGFMHGKAILIVDNSASMQSNEMGEYRLELAKQAALELIQQVSASGGMMVLVTHAAETHIQQAFTTDTAQLRRAVETIAPTAAVGNLRSVFDAAAHYADSPQDKVFFISDNFDTLPDISLPLHTIGVGGAAENIGIVQFIMEMAETPRGKLYTVLATIQNFTDTDSEITVSLALAFPLNVNPKNVGIANSRERFFEQETLTERLANNEKPFDDKLVSIPAGRTQSVLFSGDASGLEGQVIRVRLEVEDDFPLDNTASALLLPRPPLRMLLVSDRELPLLTHLLKTHGAHVEMLQVDTDAYHGSSGTDVTIFDRGSPENVPTGNVIFLNPREQLPFGEAVETDNAAARVISEDKTHPLMQGVSLMGLQVREASRRELPIWGHSLVETEKGSLIWVGTEADRQMLVFEFDAFTPELSAFALTIPAAPLFIYQSLAWFESGTAPIQPLSERLTRATRHAFRTGESLRLAFPPTARVHVQKPNQTLVEIKDAVFKQTELTGVYTVFVDETQVERFTVNLLDAAESALSASSSAPTETEQITADAPLQPVTQEVWRWPAVLAFAMLLLEWGFYHRSGT